MALTKKAAAEKLAQDAQNDRENAFEFGFYKIAQDLGLSEDEYSNFYQAGLDKFATAYEQENSK